MIVTLPLAMLIAFILMQHFGMSANLMSLAGLAIGIGDDGGRRGGDGRERLPAAVACSEAGKPMNRTHVILEAAREVINPIAFAILIIIVVFLPLFSLTGLEGKLFKPMALTITFAMVGSLILTMTLVPVLAALILKPKEEKDTFLVRWAKTAYLPLLDWALENKKQGDRRGRGTAGRGACHCSRSSARSSCPRCRKARSCSASTGIPSTSLEEIDARLATMDAVLKQEVSADEVGARHHRPRREGRDRRRQLHGGAGRREAAGRMAEEDVHARTLRRDAGDHGEALPTVVLGATQPIQMRVEELISGVRATLALKLYGEDLATLDRLAGRDRRACWARCPASPTCRWRPTRASRRLVIKVNREAAARYGINADEILEVVQAGIGGRRPSAR